MSISQKDYIQIIRRFYSVSLKKQRVFPPCSDFLCFFRTTNKPIFMQIVKIGYRNVQIIYNKHKKGVFAFNFIDKTPFFML